ncbi:MAG: hypothetical protein ABSE95_15935 [Thermodesulfobacteriota bacterium]|jgi:hypothetical protein
MLKKIYLVLLSLGVSYLLISITLFFLIAPLETSIWGLKIFFVSLVKPIELSFFLIFSGILMGLLDYLWCWLKTVHKKKINLSLHLKIRPIQFGKDLIKKIEYKLLLVLLLGAIVRYWGITFGLPETFCRPDEEIIIKTSLKFFRGDFNPEFFRYPTLLCICFMPYLRFISL